MTSDEAVKEVFDERELADGAVEVKRAARPKPAATLVLARAGAAGPEILMGCRDRAHKFMPNKWVFPGGRIDRGDAYGPGDGPSPSRGLMEVHVSPLRARAAPLAALRETYEETGLLVGRRVKPDRRARGQAWRVFKDHGLAPAVSRLEVIARAVTPPMKPIRFDAWFFLARAEEVELVAVNDGTPELDRVDWFAVDDAFDLDLPTITRHVIKLAADRMDGGDHAPPYFRFLHGRGTVVPL